MKKIIPLFLLALLPLSASAAWNYGCTLYFLDSDQHRPRYNYANADDGGEATIAGDVLAENELIRVVLVRDVRTDKSTAPFAINILGELVPAEGLALENMAWQTLSWYDNGTPASGTAIPVGKVAGMPVGDGGTPSDQVFQFDTSYTGAALAGNATDAVYAYVVAMDTRHYDAASESLKCDGVTSGVSLLKTSRYAVTKLPKPITSSPASGATHVFLFCGNDFGDVLVPGLVLDADGTVADTDMWTDACLPASMDVIVSNGNGNETTATLSGEDLEDYFSPTVASAVFNSTASGTALQLQAAPQKTAQDVAYYTLYTADSLSGEWKTFDDFLVEEKKVDNAGKKKYTRLRIDGNSLIDVPVFDDENTRFYQFRMN